MHIFINPLYLATSVLVWLLVYHVAYWLTAILRDRSLVGWSVGPLGIMVISLREPPPALVLAQIVAASCAVGAAAYALLYAIPPGPVAGLSRGLPAELGVVLVPALLFTGWRVLSIVRDLRFPLWGEARVFARVQRSVTTGALVVFTPMGRAFLRERFGTTPTEFLAMVRMPAARPRPR